MTKVSIIIPVYKVEEYIERCARSLFEQTLDDIEYIFIDDCSPDNSIQIVRDILKEYPKRQSQVRIIEMIVNSGQAAVRKKGIDEATGEYIIHCDSDDFVDKDMYRQMYVKAKEGDFDMVVCDIYEGRDNQWKWQKGKRDAKSDIITDIFQLLVPSFCNKLVNIAVAHNSSIVYPNDNMGEDLAVTLQYSLLSNSIGYIDSPLYFYERRTSSISGAKTWSAIIDKNRQLVANFNIAIDAIKRHGLKEKYEDAILHEKVWIKNQLLPAMQHQNCTKLWRDTYREINLSGIFSPVLTIREKMNFIITWLGLYPLYCKLKQYSKK